MDKAGHVALLINPGAGGGLSDSINNQLVNVAGAIGAEIVYTTVADGARQVARQFGSCQELWVAGGDGTLSQAVNGLHDQGTRVRPRVGLIPLGTGNDFAHTLGISGSISDVVKALMSGRRRSVDYCCVSIRAPGRNEPIERTMINCLGVGMDARVAARAGRLKRIGRASYVVAALGALLSRNGFAISATSDEFVLDGKYLFVAVSNGSRAGGGFYLSPNAVVDDRRLDVCMVGEAGFARSVIILQKLKSSKHDDLAEVTRETGTVVELKGMQPMPLHIDGEVFSENVEEIKVEVAATQIEFLVPGNV